MGDGHPPPPTRLGLLLIDGFAMMSYATVIEPFRSANIMDGQTLYTWRHLSTGGKVARASNGAAVIVDSSLRDADDLDILFVFAGGDPASFEDEATFAALRYRAAHGATIAGVSGGPYILARAGLLDGRSATIHWKHQTALAQAFPNVLLNSDLFVFDGRLVTCAGGMAGLDMAVAMILKAHGPALANKISEWHIRTQLREASGPQRLSLRERYMVWNDNVLTVLGLMETHIAEPLSRETLAARVRLSVRQLERLFAHHMSAAVAETYRKIRLDRALQLLCETSLSITDIAFSCGFNSLSHFSTTFQAYYGVSPREGRKSPLARALVK